MFQPLLRVAGNNEVVRVTHHVHFQSSLLRSREFFREHSFEAIERLRSEFASPIPAFLISGDIDPARLREARDQGYHLQHKPVDPMVLRAMCNQLLKSEKVPSPATDTNTSTPESPRSTCRALG